MFSRFISTILIVLILGMILAGCGVATEQPPAQQPVSEAAVPTDTAAPAVAEDPATPTPIPATEEPVAPAATEEAALTVTEEAVSAAPTEPQAAGPSADLRTFQIVADQSEASYQVQEEFFNRPVNLFNPIGRTNAIEGEFQLTVSNNQVQLAGNQFTVDLRTLTSDDPKRDQRIRGNWLESNTYPWAEFKAISIEDFPAGAAEGQDVSFKLTGDMTIREITKPQTFDVTARLDGNTFTGTAMTYLLMRDYGFDPPSILGMLQVTDGVTVTVKFVATEANAGS
ncbi:MAG: YceI family protein [Chloroflexi bacterium]|nr:YceI family protein [Chloroflexota bacterium]